MIEFEFPIIQLMMGFLSLTGLLLYAINIYQPNLKLINYKPYEKN